jgi:hypothetical protein
LIDSTQDAADVGAAAAALPETHRTAQRQSASLLRPMEASPGDDVRARAFILGERRTPK